MYNRNNHNTLPPSNIIYNIIKEKGLSHVGISPLVYIYTYTYCYSVSAKLYSVRKKDD